MFIIEILLLIALSIAVYTDIKTRKIPLFLFPGVLIIFIVLWKMEYVDITMENWIAAISLSVPLFVLCCLGKMGGGDLIMFTVIGFILGVNGLLQYMIFLAVVSTGYCLVTRKERNEEVPIAPFAAAAYLVYFGVIIWKGA